MSSLAILGRESQRRVSHGRTKFMTSNSTEKHKKGRSIELSMHALR